MSAAGQYAVLPCLQDAFTLHVDTSACGRIAAYDPVRRDTWFFRDLILQSGHVYGLVSEYGQGCEAVACMLAGQTAFDGVQVLCGGHALTRGELCSAAWNLEPLHQPYSKKQVRASIERALRSRGGNPDFQFVAEQFALTAERYDRRFSALSGERWRAAAALGYASGKRIFYAAYHPSIFYRQLMQAGFSAALTALCKAGALVLLPTGSGALIGSIADTVLYLDPETYGAE